MGDSHRPLVKLNGSPRENGHIIGRFCRGPLRRRIRDTRQIQKERRIADRTIAARVRDFTRLVKRVDRAWLHEASGLAEGASVALDDILMLNCLPSDFYSPGQNCTTFISVGKTENRLFKVRDERNHVQCFLVNCARGRKRFQAGSDIGNIGVSHFFNECALAGANNTGSVTDRVSDEPSLNDCHMMRYFAENASSVRDIPKLFERLLELRAAGGAGRGRGAIFSFADPFQCMVVEAVSGAYSSEVIKGGTRVLTNHFVTRKAKRWETRPPSKNTILRRNRMEQLLRRCSNNPTPAEVFALSRDRKNVPHSLCNDDKKHHWMTVSAQLQAIPRDAPEESLNYVCCGNTRHSLYLPVPLAFRETFVPLLSGAFYKAADMLYQEYRCGSHFRKEQKAFETSVLQRTDYLTLYGEALAVMRRLAHP